MALTVQEIPPQESPPRELAAETTHRMGDGMTLGIPFISASTLDDLLQEVFGHILQHGHHFEASRGSGREEIGALLELTNPRARLSRSEQRSKVFSCIGELLWYLSGSNELDFIGYYIPKYRDDSDDGRTIHGAYGPRLFPPGKTGQLETVANILRTPKRSGSRRAVVQLYRFDDISMEVHPREIPCTCTLQFLNRDGHLHMVVYMRSNDVYLGLPHDIFAFTMIQELMARDLGLELGRYRHCVGSLHMYSSNETSARDYMSEGYQETIFPMPPMPAGNQWPAVKSVLVAEEQIRCGSAPGSIANLDPYWSDIVRLLCIYRLHHDRTKIANVQSQIGEIALNMSSNIYAPYIEAKQNSCDRANKTR